MLEVALNKKKKRKKRKNKKELNSTWQTLITKFSLVMQEYTYMGERGRCHLKSQCINVCVCVCVCV